MVLALGTDIAHLLDNLSLTEVDMVEPSISGSHVRFGSLADIATRSRHVRFTPDNGHSSV
jgi:hypothetical protein